MIHDFISNCCGIEPAPGNVMERVVIKLLVFVNVNVVRSYILKSTLPVVIDS